MPFGPTLVERLARARADLRIGLPVVLTEGTRGAVVAAAEALSPDRLALFRAAGDPVLAITARRAETLKARAYDGDLARLALPTDAALPWVRAVADPSGDLASPMKGPFRSARDGDATLHRLAIRLAKSARLLPAALVVDLPDARGLRATATTSSILDARALAPLLDVASPLHQVVSGRVPLAAAEAGRVHVFRPEDGGEEHYAVEIGRPPRDAPRPCPAPLRLLHRRHPRLAQVRLRPAAPGLRWREWARKAQACSSTSTRRAGGSASPTRCGPTALQDQGFDTVEANHRIGFEDDERDFRLGAMILREMGFRTVRLLTNNPAKVRMMEANGIAVSRTRAAQGGSEPAQREVPRHQGEEVRPHPLTR
jgi:GTP cyclohydrolase II